MPTGYTADVQSGKVTEFADFAMQCARAFGALITMRDDPMDAAIPDEFPVDEYPMRNLIKERERLAQLKSMSAEAIRDAAAADYETALTAFLDSQRRRAEEKQRYEAMLAKVQAWQPPTPDHVEMKNFMVSQLKESIEFDCTGYERFAPQLQLAEEWHRDRVQQAERSIARYEEDHEKAVERAESRGKWVRDLRHSLAVSP